MKKRLELLSSFTLKVIACILMTLDHIALFFVSPTMQYELYYALRAIGKISFPLFVFLAFYGVYRTHNLRNYLLRLLLPGIAIDVFGYVFGAVATIPIADNPIIGNAFIDLFLGTLAVSLLRKKNWVSLLAVLPVLYAFFSTYPVDASYGTLFKTDWGFFGICLFLAFFAAKEIVALFIRYRASQDGILLEVYREENEFFLEKIALSVALVFVGLVFYLIYRLDFTSFVLPNEFVPIGTYLCLAFVFFLLASPKKGYSSKAIQYSFYAYYPFHLVLLAIVAFAIGRF